MKNVLFYCFRYYKWISFQIMLLLLLYICHNKFEWMKLNSKNMYIPNYNVYYNEGGTFNNHQLGTEWLDNMSNLLHIFYFLSPFQPNLSEYAHLFIFDFYRKIGICISKLNIGIYKTTCIKFEWALIFSKRSPHVLEKYFKILKRIRRTG
jgi:hypothetical protein